ncbi:MAG: hypothetical protein D6776_06570 [Planctomycetota bacterium]|nr:MAG: hypothetical protein D6776_06570 [Planctomycetota bacterium]
MVRNAHRFLASRGRDELEASAELYFGALGYRRRAGRPDRLVFRRGRPWGGLRSHALRACDTTVQIELSGGEDGTATVLTVTSWADLRGRIVTPTDRARLEAELRGFDRFVAGEDVSLRALVDSVRPRYRARALRRAALALLGLALGGALAWWWLR